MVYLVLQVGGFSQPIKELLTLCLSGKFKIYVYFFFEQLCFNAYVGKLFFPLTDKHTCLISDWIAWSQFVPAQGFIPQSLRLIFPSKHMLSHSHTDTHTSHRPQMLGRYRRLPKNASLWTDRWMQCEGNSRAGGLQGWRNAGCRDKDLEEVSKKVTRQTVV